MISFSFIFLNSFICICGISTDATFGIHHPLVEDGRILAILS